MSVQTDQAVQSHYGTADFATTILNALAASGKNPDQLQPQDLWPFDQLHTRGIQATRELAERAHVQAGDKVIDVGGGLGGSARAVAALYGADVTVLDLTPEFIRSGELLTERVHLADRVHFQQGNAFAMPFARNMFDLAWTQHSSMNMPDKPQLYREIFRVLKPGGRLAMHEVMAGPVQPLQFPVPWALTPEISFLLTPDQMRDLLRQTGFSEQVWVDDTKNSVEFFRQIAAAQASGTSSPDFQPVVSESVAATLRNLLINFQEDRVRVVQAVLVKPR